MQASCGRDPLYVIAHVRVLDGREPAMDDDRSRYAQELAKVGPAIREVREQQGPSERELAADVRGVSLAPIGTLDAGFALSLCCETFCLDDDRRRFDAEHTGKTGQDGSVWNAKRRSQKLAVAPLTPMPKIARSGVPR